MEVAGHIGREGSSRDRGTSCDAERDASGGRGCRLLATVGVGEFDLTGCSDLNSASTLCRFGTELLLEAADDADVVGPPEDASALRIECLSSLSLVLTRARGWCLYSLREGRGPGILGTSTGRSAEVVGDNWTVEVEAEACSPNDEAAVLDEALCDSLGRMS